MNRRGFLRVGLASAGSFAALPLLHACGGTNDKVSSNNRYLQSNLAATNASYDPVFLIPEMVDAWGIAIRPAGAGGHFWITASSASYEFVGDVNGTPIEIDPELAVVGLPPSGENAGAANGIVFNPSGPGFIITQDIPGSGTVTAPAKFIFVSDNAVMSAWTQRSNPDGTLSYPPVATTILDNNAQGSAFFGLAISPTFDQLLVADFGNNPFPRIRIFDDTFQEEDLNGRFDNPFLADQNVFVPGDYAPWNVHTLKVGDTYSVFVAYVNTSEDPDNPGQVLFATENTGRGTGRLVEFSPDGQYIATWGDRGTLNGPWGMAAAPADFGAFSNQILIGNFSDGTIVGFDPATKRATEFLRDENGNIKAISGLWGMLFGNGVKLGDSNALYFAAGPADETEGLFGSLRFAA